MKKIAVIDGNSLMHRAFHAVPSYMMTSNGVHTNAVFGFIAMLIKLVEVFEPDAVIAAFDAGIPKFRFDAIQKYKAQRPPTDPDLKEQFPLIEELLEAIGIPVVKIQGYEGDDILGTLSARGDKEGFETYLVTGDRDAFQLASERSKIVATRVGLSDVKIYGPDEVVERYGIAPDQVADFIALKGDSSDNIPGVPGVGEKTAAKLLNQYHDIENLAEHVDELKGKIAKNISDNLDVMAAGKVVATIVRDLDIDIDLDSIVFPNFDPQKAVAAFKKLEIGSHIPKVLAWQKSSNEFVLEEETLDYEIVLEDKVTNFIQELVDNNAKVAILLNLNDTNSNNGSMSLGLDLYEESKSYRLAICSDNKIAFIKDNNLNETLCLLLSKCFVITIDLKNIFQFLSPPDSSIPAFIDLDSIDSSKIFDISIGAYLLDSSRSNYTIEFLASQYLGIALEEIDSKNKNAVNELNDDQIAKRVKVIFDLYPVILDKLQSDNSFGCFENIEMPLVAVLASMERNGLEINNERIFELSKQIGQEISEVSNQIYELVGEKFNISSPKQLSEILFEKLKLPAKKRSKTGYSTNAEVLNSLIDKHPVPGLVLEYRELSKIKNTYLDTLPSMVRGDGRLHTTFNQTIAATGRLSSSDPNLQNIPVRTDLGRNIRTAFGPYKEMLDDNNEGAVFLSADYSQIELRLLAHLSGDQGLIDAFNHGSDFHTSTASRIFGLEPDLITPELRSRAKAVNFGIVYGQQAFGLSKSLSISMGEAQQMIDKYFEAYPDVRVYLDGLVEYVRKHEWVETIFGRKRHIRDINSKNAIQRSQAERFAMNHPMQGSAADIIKLAMINVERRISQEGFKSIMMLQIHDELDFSCPNEEIEALSELVQEEMSGVVELKVPLEVSISYGSTWADAK